MNKRVIVVGEIVADLLCELVDANICGIKPGGAPVNVARVLGALGLPVSLISTLGTDSLSYFIMEEIKKSGVDISGIKEKENSQIPIIYLNNKNVNLNKILPSSKIFTTELIDISNYIKYESNKVGAFYFTLHGFIDPQWKSLLMKYCKDFRGAEIWHCIDLNIKRHSWEDTNILMGAINQALEIADLIKLSDEDINEIGLDINYFLRFSSKALLWVTKGKDGATCYYKGKKVSVSVEDSIKNKNINYGAGDAFMAGIIYYFIKTHTTPHSDVINNLDYIKKVGNCAIAVASLIIKKYHPTYKDYFTNLLNQTYPK